MVEKDSDQQARALEAAARSLRIAEESAAVAARLLEIAGTPELEEEAEIQWVPEPPSAAQRAGQRIVEQLPRIRRLSVLISEQTAWIQSLSSQFGEDSCALEQFAEIQSTGHKLSDEIGRIEQFMGQGSR
jgi:hypothetical protein